MKLVFYSNYLNHHQVPLADELYKALGDGFVFVSTKPRNVNELKGGPDYSLRPYCLLAAENDLKHEAALRLAREADACIFGACSQEYALERVRQGNDGSSFEMGERWLKRGWFNILSPSFLKWWKNYMLYYRNMNFYKLCCSGFAAADDRKLGAYRDKHFKWGYFTSVPQICDKDFFETQATSSKIKILWISRFLSWKHPELPLKMAYALKEKGYDFVLDFYGTGPEEELTKIKADEFGLNDVVNFHGGISNDEVYDVMLNSDIFLFTSDRNEGWGAVANEAMANACVLVASDAIGSTPYLIKDGYNGLVFKSKDSDSLTDKVEWILNNPSEMAKIKRNAYNTMKSLWNPSNAARSLLQLIDDLQNGKESSIENGPCSKA